MQKKDFRAKLLSLKQCAFTLAETLIVMGIIGVVAALTLPNLNSSTGEKEKVAKLQKIYSNLQDAFGRAEAVYGPYDEWFVNDGNDYDKIKKRAFERITEFMKYSKACTITDCAAIFDKSGTSGGDNTTTAKYNVILADGATVGFGCRTSNCDIFIDLDGANKGANQSCRDYFRLSIDTDNFNKQKYIVTYGNRKDVENNKVFNGVTTVCTAWVLVNGNMDYLKRDSSGKCPDGEKLQFGVKTSCK